MTENGALEVAIGALSVSGSLVAWAIAQARIKAKDAERFAKIELKIETLWELQMRGGIAEAVKVKGGQVNSPMQITPVGMELMKPVLPDLKAWYKGKEQLSNTDLQLKIAVEWGERLFHDVCLPLGLKDTACIAMAFSILRPQVGTVKAEDTDPDIQTKGAP